MTLFYEDLTVGDVEEFGAYEVTEEEILAFASKYDPQYFHVDPERAREESIFGGLIASGWHTGAMTMRMVVDSQFGESATLGAKGIDEVRWHRPVRPGDVLSVRVEILDKESDRPDRGDVRVGTETRNDDGETVMTYESIVMYAKRAAVEGDEDGGTGRDDGEA
ncbi:MaoC family dehydratase [Halobium palmae]|uniref:MaoC family dehydratase n=1 Tax=Halobium palmae TaxID=1776492 RepID=A0ABD5S2X3_9EURY